MALLNIICFPDPRLRVRTTPVHSVGDGILQLIDDMFETMYAAPGIGLAAPQVNFTKQIIVIDISEDKTEPLCLINPEIVAKQGDKEYEEGCLSVPGIYETVRRAESIRVRALDREGKPFEMEADGLLSVCVQHEIDHLQGKLFVDYLSSLKRQRIRKKLEKAKRQDKGQPAESQGQHTRL